MPSGRAAASPRKPTGPSSLGDTSAAAGQAIPPEYLAVAPALRHSALMAHDLPVGAPVALDLPRPRPPRAPMQGRFCRLVPTEAAHAPGLFAAFAGDEAGWAYLPYGPFAAADAFADWLAATCLGDDPLFHTILAPDGRPLGLASYLRIDPANGVIEVGHIHYGPALQGTAAATEAMSLMMARVFDKLGYRRYEWKCNALNDASRRAAARLGFTYEGTFRQAAVVKGRNRDTAWFSILDVEWPARRAAFADWFASLDADGRQTAPLAR
jgi:RimJ/RimL family protein N-acetyltransferase